jgi:hypothetical protein
VQPRDLESASICLFIFPEFAWRNSHAIFDASGEVKCVREAALVGDFG